MVFPALTAFLAYGFAAVLLHCPPGLWPFELPPCPRGVRSPDPICLGFGSFTASRRGTDPRRRDHRSSPPARCMVCEPGRSPHRWPADRCSCRRHRNPPANHPRASQLHAPQLASLVAGIVIGRPLPGSPLLPEHDAPNARRPPCRAIARDQRRAHLRIALGRLELARHPGQKTCQHQLRLDAND